MSLLVPLIKSMFELLRIFLRRRINKQKRKTNTSELNRNNLSTQRADYLIVFCTKQKTTMLVGKFANIYGESKQLYNLPECNKNYKVVP